MSKEQYTEIKLKPMVEEIDQGQYALEDWQSDLCDCAIKVAIILLIFAASACSFGAIGATIGNDLYS
ncbi:MAG: hypothetical protein AAGC77_10175 [Pseudomonadota bacterium]